MRDHTVDIDTSASPTTFDFARNFNVAVPFIDQHLELGRAHRVAIRSDHGDVTYGELAERVNRAGNGLRNLGIEQGARILMVVADVPAFFYLWTILHIASTTRRGDLGFWLTRALLQR